MHIIPPETERSDRRSAPRAGFTPGVYRMLMLGGTLLMILAVLGDMQPRLTCVAALWSVSGLYGLSEVLRKDRRRTLPYPGSFCSDPVRDY